jgi:hypothetical protein
MIAQPRNFLKSIAVINIDLMNVVLLPWVRRSKQMSSVGKFKLNNSSQNYLSVVPQI